MRRKFIRQSEEYSALLLRDRAVKTDPYYSKSASHSLSIPLRERLLECLISQTVIGPMWNIALFVQ